MAQKATTEGQHVVAKREAVLANNDQESDAMDGLYTGFSSLHANPEALPETGTLAKLTLSDMPN